MDYVVGSVAALISGNVTPNRSRIVKRALTPTKHQPSPNVTPKSQIVDDRSIFLSPTVQKKKAIVKKSPKRIFQNPDNDESLDENGATVKSPKADLVKKHLKDDLDADENKKVKKPKGKNNVPNSPKKNRDCIVSEIQDINENTPKKKKKRVFDSAIEESVQCDKENLETESSNYETSPKKIKKSKADKVSPETNLNINQDEELINANNTKSLKKRKHAKSNTESEETSVKPDGNTKDNIGATIDNQQKSKKKRNKKKAKKQKSEEIKINNETSNNLGTEYYTHEEKKKKKVKTVVNPNAVTNKDTDSEHESDNEIESETEETNKKVLNEGPVDDSSDEDQKKLTNSEEKRRDFDDEEDIKKTLFVGNAPLSKKLKKEIRKIFLKYGDIQTVRIRTVPVKDARVTPKLAVIKNELHPSRSTVNVYVKFADPSSVEKALVENNSVYNEHHLRVSRSNSTGAESDPRLAVFVGNLPFSAEDDALREKFIACGEIRSVRIVRDRKTNAGKGFGYVNFTSKDAVELALGLSEEDLTMKNRILRVKRCTQVTDNQKKRQNFSKDRNSKPREWMKNRHAPDGRQGKPFGQGRPEKSDGAYRRILKKRDLQDSSEGPPNKRARNINQPSGEKKARKEFVGMTAEKKKKQKFNKQQKKKKALSEILTK